MQLAVRRPERIFITPEESLRTGRLDLALGFFPAANELDRSLRSADLLQEENVCIGSERNPLLRAKRLSVQSFARAGHVGIFYAPERRGLVDELLKPLGVQRRLAATTSHLMIAPYLVAGSDLLAVVPAGLAQRFCRPLRLAIRQLPFSMPPFHLRMVWHERADEDAAHAWLRSLILDVFSGRSHAPSAASVGGARRG
jgi:DNA-binding transcriptional LysR family regulator